MRKTNLALMCGLVTMAIYGCGSDGGGKATDAARDTIPPTNTLTGTSTQTSTTTQTSTQTTTSTLTTTTTQTSVDGGAGNPDAAISGVNDGGGTGIDMGITQLDAGGVDAGVTADVGSTGIDTGTSLIDSAGVDGGATVDVGMAADAPATTDSPTSTGSCNYPQCYIDIFTDCAPSGSCVLQTTAGTSSATTNICFDNGVKDQSVSTFTFDLGTLTMTGTTISTWKNAAGICYTIEEPYSSASVTSLTQTYKSPAGVALATVTIDTTANTQTITCTGQSPVVLPTNCGSSDADAGSSATCPTGTCTF